MCGLRFGGQWRWTHHFLLVIWLSQLAATPPIALGYFLGDTKAVLTGCEDQWTLQAGVSVPQLYQMTVCVDVQVVIPGAWRAFTYSSAHAPRPELGLEGDDEALYAWLLRVQHRFPIQLSPARWYRVCLRRDIERKSFSLEVDGEVKGESTVIAGAIPGSGALLLGCHSRGRPPGGGAAQQGLGKVDLYLFRVWDDIGYHDACDDGTVIGWNARYWGVTSPKAREKDQNLLCGFPSTTATSRPTITTPVTLETSKVTGSSLVNCDISQLCSNSTAYFLMSIRVEVRGNRNTEGDVRDWVSNVSSCHGYGGFADMDFCLDRRQLQVEQVNCRAKNNIRSTVCNVLLQMSHAVSACELQQAAASALQSGGEPQIWATIIGVVERVGWNLCGNVAPSSGRFVRCMSTSPLQDICEARKPSQLKCSLIDSNSSPAPQSNTESCNSEAPRFCDCTAFCNSASQFFAIRISVNSASVNTNLLRILFSTPGSTGMCKTMSLSTCQNIINRYQKAYLECHGTQQRLYSCMVILQMSGEVNSCLLSRFVQQLINSNTGIRSEGQLTRMMACGPPGLSDLKLLASNLTWVHSDLLTSNVCQPYPTLLKCEAGETLAVLLNDSCPPEPSTTKQSTTQHIGNITTTPPPVTNTSAQTRPTAANTTAALHTNTSQGTSQPNTATAITTRKRNATQSSTVARNMTVTDNTTMSKPKLQNTTTAQQNTKEYVSSSVNLTSQITVTTTADPTDSTLNSTTSLAVSSNHTTAHNVTTGQTFSNNTTAVNNRNLNNGTITTTNASASTVKASAPTNTTGYNVTTGGTVTPLSNKTVDDTTVLDNIHPNNATLTSYTTVSMVTAAPTARPGHNVTTKGTVTSFTNNTTVDNVTVVDNRNQNNHTRNTTASTFTAAPNNTASYNITIAANNYTIAATKTSRYNVTTVANNHTTGYNVTTAVNNLTAVRSKHTTLSSVTTTANNHTAASNYNYKTVTPNHTTVHTTTVVYNVTTAGNIYTTVAPNHTTEDSIPTVANNHTTTTNNNRTGNNFTTAANNYTMVTSKTVYNISTVSQNATTVANNYTTVAPNNTTVQNTSTVGYNVTTEVNNYTTAASNHTTEHSITTVATNYTTATNNYTTVAINPITAHNNSTVGYNVTKVANYHTTVAKNITTDPSNYTTVALSHTPVHNITNVGHNATTVANNDTTVSNNHTTSNNYTAVSNATAAANNYTSAQNVTIVTVSQNKTSTENVTTTQHTTQGSTTAPDQNTTKSTTAATVTTKNTTTSMAATLKNQTENHTTAGVTHNVTTTNSNSVSTTAVMINFNETTATSLNQSITANTITPDVNNTTTTTASTTHSSTTSQINTTIANDAITFSETTLDATTVTTTTTTQPETTQSQESQEEQVNQLLDQTQDVSQLNSSQVANLADQLEKLLNGSTVSKAVGEKMLRVISNLLESNSSALSGSSSRLVRVVEGLGEKLTVTGDSETLSAASIVLAVKTVDGTNFLETSVNIFNTDNLEFRALGRSRIKRSSSPLGSIILPSTLTAGLSPEQQQQASRVQFTFYTKPALFQDVSLNNQIIVSPVLGCSVANLSISSLSENIQFTIRNIEPISGNYTASCTFWDFSLNDGGGGWSSAGCSVVNATADDTICSCNHLTSFAILLDLSREGIIDRQHAQILTFITYIGCGISAIFLAVTLLTYLSFEKLLRDIPAKILVQLCLSLLLLNMVFLLDGWLALYPAVGLCISTAFFLHYFLLTSFTWAGLEALHMYLSIVRVFTPYLSRYMLKFSLVGWGIPLIVVIIIIAVDKDNYGLVTYGRYTDGTSDDFCWLRNDIAFYVGVVAYFLLIFALCLVVFVVVMVQLSRIKKQNPQNQAPNRGLMTDLRSIAGLVVLLGLTWGFALFAWGPLYLPFVYLFSIFNTLQGFLIFILHCAIKENVRRQWRTYLCCGKLRLAENSDWSRTATQNNRNMSVTTATTSAPHLTSRSSSVTSDGTNSSGSVFIDSGISDGSSSDVILNELHRQNMSL